VSKVQDHEPEAGHMPQARLLLVAQSPLVREGVKHLLAEDALSVAGEEPTLMGALSFLRAGKQAVEVILYDQDESEGGKFAALRTIRNEFPEIAVVILTAETSRNEIDEAIRAGARGILPKSFSGKALYFAIQLLLLQ